MEGSISCIIYVGWNTPINVAPDEISHYRIFINETNVLNKTTNINQNLIMTAYPVCTCTEHQVRVGAVDHCGRDGQRSPSITPNHDLVQYLVTFFNNECEFVIPTTNPYAGK